MVIEQCCSYNCHWACVQGWVSCKVKHEGHRAGAGQWKVTSSQEGGHSLTILSKNEQLRIQEQFDDDTFSSMMEHTLTNRLGDHYIEILDPWPGNSQILIPSRTCAQSSKSGWTSRSPHIMINSEH